MEEREKINLEKYILNITNCIKLIHTKSNISEQKISYPRWSNYHTSPMCEGHVIIILQAPTNCAIAHTFLALL